MIADIAEQARKLQQSEALEVQFSKTRLLDPADADMESGHDKIKRRYGLDCPASILQSLVIADELSAYWRSRELPPSRTVVGEFSLISVLLFAAVNPLNEDFLAQTYPALDLRQSRVFDGYPYQGGPIHSVLPVREGRIEDQVYIFNERDVYRTTLDYASYLAALRLTRGFLYWQYLFCNGIKLDLFEQTAIRNGLAFVRKTFPEDDYSDLQRRMEQPPFRPLRRRKP